MKLPLLHRAKSPEVVGGLTRASRARKIAEITGENPSKIKGRLDKAAEQMAREQGKRDMANRNPMGSLEYATRYAVQKLGAKRVADLLGVGEWSLYKGVNPNDEGRKLPDLSWQRVAELVRALRREGHAEFFSTAIQAEAGALDPAAPLPSVHHALSRTSGAHGEVARLLLQATDPDSDGGEDITPAEAAQIAEAVERCQGDLKHLLAQVLAEAGGQ